MSKIAVKRVAEVNNRKMLLRLTESHMADIAKAAKKAGIAKAAFVRRAVERAIAYSNR